MSLTQTLHPQHSTPQIVAALFPASNFGRAFYHRFVAYVHHHPAQGDKMEPETAVICTQSIEQLGTLLDCAPDTTRRYVALFEALGLLQKRCDRGQRVFVLMQGAYQPPQTLAANLDTLRERWEGQKSRNTMYRLLHEVRERCLHLGLLTASEEPDQVAQSISLVQHVLTLPEGASKRLVIQRLALAQHHLSATLTHLLSGTDSFTPNDHQEQESHPSPDPQQEPEEEGAHPGEVQTEEPDEQAHPSNLILAQSDLSVSHVPPLPSGKRGEVASPLRDVDISNIADKTTTLRHVDVSNTTDKTTLRHAEETKTVDTTLCHAEEKKIHPKTSPARENVQERAIPPLDAVLEQTTLHDLFMRQMEQDPERVAVFLAEQLEQDRGVDKKYLKLFFVQPGQPRDPVVLRAAYICTMVRLHRDHWKLTRPGGFFTVRCREFDAGIPAEVEHWVLAYGNLAACQLRDALTTSASTAAVPASSARASLAQPDAPAQVSTPLTLAVSTPVERERMSMSREEAHAFAESVQRDRRTRGFRVRCLQSSLTQGYAVLIDATGPAGIPHQVVIYNPANWQARLESMQHWLDLFRPEPAPSHDHPTAPLQAA